ncbi:hypothetical protein KL943_002481 [Ogataea angusta]|nr:hypothetical protein KL943_002481 [Ogataea angusta]
MKDLGEMNVAWEAYIGPRTALCWHVSVYAGSSPSIDYRPWRRASPSAAAKRILDFAPRAADCFFSPTKIFRFSYVGAPGEQRGVLRKRSRLERIAFCTSLGGRREGRRGEHGVLQRGSRLRSGVEAGRAGHEVPRLHVVEQVVEKARVGVEELVLRIAARRLLACKVLGVGEHEGQLLCVVVQLLLLLLQLEVCLVDLVLDVLVHGVGVRVDQLDVDAVLWAVDRLGGVGGVERGQREVEVEVEAEVVEDAHELDQFVERVFGDVVACEGHELEQVDAARERCVVVFEVDGDEQDEDRVEEEVCVPVVEGDEQFEQLEVAQHGDGFLGGVDALAQHLRDAGVLCGDELLEHGERERPARGDEVLVRLEVDVDERLVQLAQLVVVHLLAQLLKVARHVLLEVVLEHPHHLDRVCHEVCAEPGLLARVHAARRHVVHGVEDVVCELDERDLQVQEPRAAPLGAVALADELDLRLVELDALGQPDARRCERVEREDGPPHALAARDLLRRQVRLAQVQVERERPARGDAEPHVRAGDAVERLQIVPDQQRGLDRRQRRHLDVDGEDARAGQEVLEAGRLVDKVPFRRELAVELGERQLVRLDRVQDLLADRERDEDLGQQLRRAAHAGVVDPAELGRELGLLVQIVRVAEVRQTQAHERLGVVARRQREHAVVGGGKVEVRHVVVDAGRVWRLDVALLLLGVAKGHVDHVVEALVVGVELERQERAVVGLRAGLAVVGGLAVDVVLQLLDARLQQLQLRLQNDDLAVFERIHALVARELAIVARRLGPRTLDLLVLAAHTGNVVAAAEDDRVDVRQQFRRAEDVLFRAHGRAVSRHSCVFMLLDPSMLRKRRSNILRGCSDRPVRPRRSHIVDRSPQR